MDRHVSSLWAPIVMVEDNADDAFFVFDALEAAKIKNPVVVCRNGAEARRLFARSHSPYPALFILDINLPGGESGLEFLAWARGQESRVAGTPALVLTGSDRTEDHLVAETLGVTRYLVKPVSAVHLVEAVQLLGVRMSTNMATGEVRLQLAERT
jgi:DNA-binding response OmpR family regulator